MTFLPPGEVVTHAEGTTRLPGLAVARPALAGAGHAERVLGGTRRGTA